jgi:hypothetical protein
MPLQHSLLVHHHDDDEALCRAVPRVGWQVKDPGFKLYAERFIMPSYAARAASAEAQAQAQAQAAGQTQAPTPTVSPAKFFAARILWDESMATGAARYLQVPCPALPCRAVPHQGGALSG